MFNYLYFLIHVVDFVKNVSIIDLLILILSFLVFIFTLLIIHLKDGFSWLFAQQAIVWKTYEVSHHSPSVRAEFNSPGFCCYKQIYSVVIFLLDEFGYISEGRITRLKVDGIHSIWTALRFLNNGNISPHKDGAKSILLAFIYCIWAI